MLTSIGPEYPQSDSWSKAAILIYLAFLVFSQKNGYLSPCFKTVEWTESACDILICSCEEFTIIYLGAISITVNNL